MYNVFVYGTLKLGGSNNHIMRQAGGEFIGKAETLDDNFLMVDLGAFPAVIKLGAMGDAFGYEIEGELWTVKDMSLLDKLEGHPHYYYRTNTVLELYNGEHISAHIYVMDMDRITDNVMIIRSGEWSND